MDSREESMMWAGSFMFIKTFQKKQPHLPEFSKERVNIASSCPKSIENRCKISSEGTSLSDIVEDFVTGEIISTS